MEKLIEEFCRIKEKHRKAILKRVAKVCVGSSTVRVFKHSNQIKERLQNIDVEELLKIKNDDNFREWFENKLRVKLGCHESGLMIIGGTDNELYKTKLSKKYK